MNPAFFKVIAARVEQHEKLIRLLEEQVKALQEAAQKRGPGRPPKTE